jgi:F-type H+-transporting ATPase subunit b
MASAALDFDITMVIQFGIFALTVAILHVLIIKPYMQAREARSEGTEGSREDADEMHERAEQVLARYEERLTEARRDAVKVREDFREEGLTNQSAMVSEVRAELAKKLEGERQTLRERVVEAEDELEARADQLATMMVERVVPELSA